MNLYFYSITSMGIGLPSVTVYRGSTVVEYHIFGNDDITQEDSMRRQILLSLRSTSSSRSYTLQFDFENTDVDWLVLSETRLCRFPPQGIYAHNPHNICMHMHAPARCLTGQECSQGVFFTEALAEFQHVNCMVVRIWEVKTVAMLGLKLLLRVASMVATPLQVHIARLFVC